MLELLKTIVKLKYTYLKQNLIIDCLNKRINLIFILLILNEIF